MHVRSSFLALLAGGSGVVTLAGMFIVPIVQALNSDISAQAAVGVGAAVLAAIAVPIIIWRRWCRAGETEAARRSGAALGFVGLIFACGAMMIGVAVWQTGQVVRHPEAQGRQTAVRQSLIDTGRLLAQNIERITTPAMERGRKIAADPSVIAALMAGTSQDLTSACNTAIAGSTEIDVVALFDAKGRIVAINTRYADGRTIPQERVDRIMKMNFADRKIISGCVNNSSTSEALEFQTSCDITPAFFDSSGLSVAHSVPVYGPSGSRLGLVSTRLRFDRITELASARGIAGGQGAVRFVTDKGRFFDEALNRGEAPPIPPEELAPLTASLAHGNAEMMTVSRHGTFHALFGMPNLKTIEDGGIHVMLSVPDSWIRRESMFARTLEIGTPAAAGLLLLLIGALLHASMLASHRAKLVERAAGEAEDLRSIVDGQSLLSITDLRGRIIDVNDMFCRVSGYSRDELLGKDHRLLNSGVHPKAFWVEMWRTIAGGKAWRAEVCNKAKDGSLYWVDTSIASFTGADGRIEKFVSIRNDITARKQAELAMVASERRMRTIINAEPECVKIVGPGDVLLEMNSAGLAMFEAESAAQIRELSLLSFVLPAYQSALSAMHADVLCGESKRLAFEIQGLRGTRRWLDAHAVPLRNTAGEVEAVLAVTRDISEQKRAEAKAREAEEFLRNAIDSLNAHTVVIGGDGKIRSVNRAWAEFAAANGGAGPNALEGGDYLGVCDRAAIKSEEAAAVSAAIRAVLSGDVAPAAIEYPCHAPHEKRWFMCSIRGFSLSNERFAVISHLNITAIKLAEQELTQANESLARAHAEVEQRVEQRTAQLAVATEAAQAASKAKSEFLATMSHEIRTPLNGLVGTLDLLSGTGLSEQQKRYIQIGKFSALSLTSVINDILDFSKIEAGKLELSPVDFDLRCTVGDVMEMLAVRASEKNLEVACSIDPALPELVRGDPDRLRQIIINLVNNAVKFTQRGSIALRVAPVGEGLNARIRFSVTDTGIGIPPDRLDRLFKAFSQTDASFSRKYGGTGLGLAICKQLAGLMGGSVGVESEPGVGSTFWFEVQLPASRAPKAEASPAGAVDFRTLRILVVEDHDVQREFIAECLASLRFPVETTDKGQSALTIMLDAAAAGRPFAAVLTDHEMPGMDGVEVAVAMRSRPELAGIPVILMSSALDLDPARVRAAGFASHLTKPLRQSTLLDAVMAAVAPKTGAITLATGRDTAPPAIPVSLEPATVKPRRRVLLAEDNEVNQLIACELLSKNGFDCTVAANGIAAVAAVSKDPYDVVLMDCQMPEMDGFEATREIRRLEKAGALKVQWNPRLPIIALTANALKGDRERCLESGMDGYSAKPIDLNLLTKTIDSLVSTHTLARAAA